VGYSREELLAKTFRDITHPHDLAADLAYSQRAQAGEIGSYASEKRYIRKDAA
jgi:PAS domain S-box-containing protein